MSIKITKVKNNITLLGAYYEANRTDGGGFAVVRQTPTFDNSLTKYYNSVVDAAKESMKYFKSKSEWSTTLNDAIKSYNRVAFGADVRDDSGGQLNEKSIEKCHLVETLLLVGIAKNFIKDDEYNGFLTTQHINKQESIPFNVLAH